MGDTPHTPPGWLPPQAPSGAPRPRFEPPAHAPASAPTSPPDAGGPSFVARQQRAPGAGRGGHANTYAIASLVCGVAGLGLLVVTLGLGFFFALPCSIAAWLCAVQAKRRIADGRLRRGSGQAQAGQVLGMVGLALGVLAMVVWVALILSGFSIAGFQRDLERRLEQQRRSDAQPAVVQRAT